jgi:putative transposase
MSRKEPFEIGEWYHCYNRGVDKRTIFLDQSHYERFIKLLYLCNDSNVSVHIQGETLNEIPLKERGEPFVSLGAYALMPNHFHFLLREDTPNGITTFMRKLMTGYTMYFNIRHERTGALFGGAFKSKHVADDRYLKRLVNYIHANPAELVEPGWKRGEIENPTNTKRFLEEYPYSSLPDYVNKERLESRVLEMVEIRSYYDTITDVSIEQLFKDALNFAQVDPFP